MGGGGCPYVLNKLNYSDFFTERMFTLLIFVFYFLCKCVKFTFFSGCAQKALKAHAGGFINKTIQWWGGANSSIGRY